MYLYNMTLQRGSGITHAIHGNFSGGKVQEILVSRGKSLELMRPDTNTGKVHTLLTVEVFGIIRALMSFRQSGGTKGKILFFNLVLITLTLYMVFDFFVINPFLSLLVLILNYSLQSQVYAEIIKLK